MSDAPTFTATPLPGVYLARRSGGSWHVIENVPSPFALCHCQAGQHGQMCWALDLAGRESNRLIEEGSNPMPEETAVAVVQRSAAVQRVTNYQQQVAGHLGMWADLKTLGASHIATKFAPKGVDSPEQAALIILKAMELNIPITSAYEFIDVIEGRPRLRGQMIGALVSRSGVGHIHVEHTDPLRCVAVGFREGRKPVRVECKLDQFRHLSNKDVWKNYPADMLRWKTIARVGRIMFPDVLGGMEVAGQGETIDDSEEAIGAYEIIDVTPSDATPTEPATAPVREPEAEKAAPAFWTAMLTKMPTLGLTAGDMAAFMEREFNAREVQAYCSQEGIGPAALLDRVAAAKAKNAPPPEPAGDTIEGEVTELPFEDDEPAADWWGGFESAMEAGDVRPMDVSAKIGKPFSKDAIAEFCMAESIAPLDLVASLTPTPAGR